MDVLTAVILQNLQKILKKVFFEINNRIKFLFRIILMYDSLINLIHLEVTNSKRQAQQMEYYHK